MGDPKAFSEALRTRTSRVFVHSELDPAVWSRLAAEFSLGGCKIEVSDFTVGRLPEETAGTSELKVIRNGRI